MEKKKSSCVGILLILACVLGWVGLCAVLFYSTGSILEGLIVGFIIYLLVDGFLGFMLAKMAIAEILDFFGKL